MWKDSTELGVGMARNRNGEVYVVCNYNPAGNFLGSFTENVLPLGVKPLKKTLIEALPYYTLDEQAWQQDALMVHNEYRRKHRVSDLRLSVELTSAAKVYFPYNNYNDHLFLFQKKKNLFHFLNIFTHLYQRISSSINYNLS